MLKLLMELFSLLLLSLKLGVYSPSADLPAWFYLSSTLMEQNRPTRAHPLGIEFGVSEEPFKEAVNVLGFPGITTKWKPAYFLGGTVAITKHDLQLSAGVKHRSGFGPYLGLSLRFASLKHGERA